MFERLIKLVALTQSLCLMSKQTCGLSSRAKGLDVPGFKLDNVKMLETPEDARQIHSACLGSNVVLVGTSFVGTTTKIHTYFYIGQNDGLNWVRTDCRWKGRTKSRLKLSLKYILSYGNPEIIDVDFFFPPGMEIASYLIGKASSITVIGSTELPYQNTLGPEIGRATMMVRTGDRGSNSCQCVAVLHRFSSL